jgi:hypothetical protein
MMPEWPELKLMAAEDLPELRECYLALMPETCDLSPASLFIWRDCEIPSLTRIHGQLCVMLEPHLDPAYFLEPFGSARIPETMRACLSRTQRISRVRQSVAAGLAPEEFDIRPLRDHYDYVYETRTLAELKGKGFDGKRNHIRRFARVCPGSEFRPLEPSQFHHAAALFERWSELREVGYAGPQPPASYNHGCQRHAIERAFQDYERLGLFGGGLFVQGEMQGFIVGSDGARDSAIAHFQYANAELPGIYQTLLWEACRHLFRHRPYINLEEDLGIPGLRKTKLSYRPFKLEEKYEIRLKGTA